MLFIAFRPRGIAHDNVVSKTARRLQEWDLQYALRASDRIILLCCTCLRLTGYGGDGGGGGEEGLSLRRFVPDLGVA